MPSSSARTGRYPGESPRRPARQEDDIALHGGQAGAAQQYSPRRLHRVGVGEELEKVCSVLGMNESENHTPESMASGMAKSQVSGSAWFSDLDSAATTMRRRCWRARLDVHRKTSARLPTISMPNSSEQQEKIICTMAISRRHRYSR